MAAGGDALEGGGHADADGETEGARLDVDAPAITAGTRHPIPTAGAQGRPSDDFRPPGWSTV
ncbi:hypothetical protein GCM10009564_08060 [Streptomyces thermogriseus]|uniref:Uncharacterized protein n=1 Tax=Streptomyces thermogriseus TaxID=75292 RepID=A0ABN1SUS0_9ACTN